MNLKNLKKLAKRVCGAGYHRIKFPTENYESYKNIVSREDIRNLFNEKKIYIAKIKPTSNKKKTIKKPRLTDKRVWMKKIRGLRKYYSELKNDSKINPQKARKIYLKVKANIINTRKKLKLEFEKCLTEEES